MENSLMVLNGLTLVFGVYGTLVALKGVYLLANWMTAKRAEARIESCATTLGVSPRHRIA